MKIQTKTYEYSLCEKTVDEISDQARSFLFSLKTPKRDISRYTLTLEEILLKELDENQGAKVRFKTGKRFFSPFFSLEIDGKSRNVFVNKRENQGVLGHSILSSIGLSPEYTFTGDSNLYSFRIKHRKVNPAIPLIISVVLGLLVGAVGMLIPSAAKEFLQTNIISPVHDAFMSVLGCIAGPMIFLSVAWGIYGIGDAATLKRIGKRILGAYIGLVFLVVTLVTLACLPFFSLNFTNASGGGNEYSAIVTMILNIIPKNIFSPFIDGNTLQIIFLAVVIGIAMLFLGQKTTAVAKAVEQINYIVQFLIDFISRLVPLFIFIVLVQMFWSGAIAVYAGVLKLFIVFVAGALVFLIVFVVYTGIRNKVSPIMIFKKGIPALVIGLTTASSAAAFGANVNACRTKYGIDDSISSFGIPLGMVTSKPITSIDFLVTGLFFAESLKIDVSVSWVVVLIITCAILAVATPPIPGGAVTSYTVLLMQLGIPMEALAIALAADTLFDFIGTGINQFSIPLVLLNQAGKIDLVDRNILTKK